jgi:hypothetical protein
MDSDMPCLGNGPLTQVIEDKYSQSRYSLSFEYNKSPVCIILVTPVTFMHAVPSRSKNGISFSTSHYYCKQKVHFAFSGNKK